MFIFNMLICHVLKQNETVKIFLVKLFVIFVSCKNQTVVCIAPTTQIACVRVNVLSILYH